MSDVKKQLEVVFELLKLSSTKEPIVKLLKSKQLHHSGTWAELFEKRVLPAVNDGKITLTELINILSDSEEHGKQHVFLFQLKNFSFENYKKENFTKMLKELKLDSVTSTPLVLKYPDKPTITDINWGKNEDYLLIKRVSTRVRYQLDKDIVENGYLNKRYKIIKDRAVCVLKLSQEGFIEIRISSKANSTKYWDDVLEFLDSLKKLLPINKIMLSPINLNRAKDYIWEERNDLSNQIRYSDATLRNDNGTLLKAVSADKASDLLDDSGASNSVNAFLEDNAYCEGNNIFFKSTKNNSLEKEIHVLMSGEINEYSLPVHCTKEEYNYVLESILKFNK